MEVEAAIRDIGQRREAARVSGFPGKGIYTMVSCAEKADAMIAAARPEFGALARDGMLCAGIAELKVDDDRMKKAVFLRRTSYSVGGLFAPLMGGYEGGPEGTSLILIAHHFRTVEDGETIFAGLAMGNHRAVNRVFAHSGCGDDRNGIDGF